MINFHRHRNETNNVSHTQRGRRRQQPEKGVDNEPKRQVTRVHIARIRAALAEDPALLQIHRAR